MLPPLSRGSCRMCLPQQRIGRDEKHPLPGMAPTMKPNEERVSLPLYFPQFWATVTAQRNTTGIGGKITLDIVKVHGTSLVQITHTCNSAANRFANSTGPDCGIGYAICMCQRCATGTIGTLEHTDRTSKDSRKSAPKRATSL